MGWQHLGNFKSVNEEKHCLLGIPSSMNVISFVVYRIYGWYGVFQYWLARVAIWLEWDEGWWCFSKEKVMLCKWEGNNI